MIEVKKMENLIRKRYIYFLLIRNKTRNKYRMCNMYKLVQIYAKNCNCNN